MVRQSAFGIRHSALGFTLVELLAAIAIMAILMVIIFSIYNQASKAWVLGEKRVETFQNVRLVLENLGRELETAIATSNTISGKKITFINVKQAGTLPGSPTQLAATPPNDQLFFVGASADTAGQGYHDLTEYGYFVVYAKQDYNTVRSNYYYLIRHATRSHDSGGAVNANFDIFASPTDWHSTPGYSTSTKVPILDNVLRLWIMFEAENTGDATYGTDIVEGWTNATYECGFGQPSSFGVSNPEVVLPRAVHIRIAVLERRYAARLAAYFAASLPTGISSNDIARIIPNCSTQDVSSISNPLVQTTIREGIHYFYKTVYLRNHP